MPVSILIVLHDFSLGGTERISVRLANAWAKLGICVTIFCGNDSGPLKSLASPKVRIVGAHPAIRRGPGSRRALGRAAASFLEQNPAEACFIPGNYHWPIAPALARISRKHRGVIVAQISADIQKPQRGRLQQRLFDMRMRLLLRSVDGLIAMSEEARIAAEAVVPNCVRVIPLPVLDNGSPPACPAPEGPPVVLGAGRLVPEKNFSRLIDAFARLPIDNATLVVAGSGPEEARLKLRASQLGVGGRVKFLGYVEDIRPALDAASLFVLASKFEGFGAVIIEALAAGRPVVMTDCSPAARLLEASGAGIVVPIDDVRALADAMTAMLDGRAYDPGRLAKLVTSFRIDEVAPKYIEFFEELGRYGERPLTCA